MKNILPALTAGAICLVIACGSLSCIAQHKSRANTGIPYPLPLPDTTPITFLPGVVSSDSIDFNSAFSKDGKSFYFTRKIRGKSKIHISRYNGRDWTIPVIAPFSNTRYADADPAFAADGKLYFISNRPKTVSDTISADYDIWFCKPLAGGRWSEPENLKIVNSDSAEYYISFAKNGNLYFASSRKGGFGEEDIYRSRLVNGKYTRPENLGPAINSKVSEYDPCISPDEDYIVFTSSGRKDSFGGADLYCAKLDANRKWAHAVNLGKNFNTKYREYCAYFSPDSRCFFFSSNGDVKWIEIRAVQKIIQH